MMTEENRMKKTDTFPLRGSEGCLSLVFRTRSRASDGMGFSSGFWRPIDAVMLLVYGGQNSLSQKKSGHIYYGK